MAKYYLGERAAQAVRQLMRGGSSVGTVPGAVGEPIDVKSFAEPYTVQWSETDSSWVIWLPDLDRLCYYRDIAQTIPAPGAASEILGDGWYKVDSLDDEGILYLEVQVNAGSRAVESVSWSVSPSTPTTGTDVYSTAICEVSYDEESTERTVKQYVVSAVRVGSFADPDPGCFEPVYVSDDKYNVLNPYYRVGGKTYQASVTKVEAEDGEIVALKITADTATPQAEIVAYSSLSTMQNEEKSLYHFIVPLYILSAGKITCDFRKGAIAVMSEF